MIVVTGSEGFVGRHLTARLRERNVPLRALKRDHGDLTDARTAARLVDGARVVVHLAGVARARDPVIARNVARACVEADVTHLIHCSTAMVAGRAPGDVVSESTPCAPRAGYERAKYIDEEEIRRTTAGKVRTTIVRPTAAFGRGGRNLRSLVLALRQFPTPLNLLRSFVYGHRTMGLVPVENLVAAFEVLIDDPPDAGTLIVSADEDPSNEYQSVERLVAQALGRGTYRGSPVTAPPFVLSTLQRFRARNTLPPRRRFVSEHAEWSSRIRAIDFSEAVQRFARSVVEGGS